MLRTHDAHSDRQQRDYVDPAFRAAKTADKAGAFRWMMITAALGLVFTVLHIRDWLNMMSQGVGLLQESPGGLPPCGAASSTPSPGCSLLHITGRYDRSVRSWQSAIREAGTTPTTSKYREPFLAIRGAGLAIYRSSWSIF